MQTALAAFFVSILVNARESLNCAIASEDTGGLAQSSRSCAARENHYQRVEDANKPGTALAGDYICHPSRVQIFVAIPHERLEDYPKYMEWNREFRLKYDITTELYIIPFGNKPIPFVGNLDFGFYNGLPPSGHLTEGNKQFDLDMERHFDVCGNVYNETDATIPNYTKFNFPNDDRRYHKVMSNVGEALVRVADKLPEYSQWPRNIKIDEGPDHTFVRLLIIDDYRDIGLAQDVFHNTEDCIRSRNMPVYCDPQSNLLTGGYPFGTECKEYNAGETLRNDLSTLYCGKDRIRTSYSELAHLSVDVHPFVDNGSNPHIQPTTIISRQPNVDTIWQLDRMIRQDTNHDYLSTYERLIPHPGDASAPCNMTYYPTAEQVGRALTRLGIDYIYADLFNRKPTEPRVSENYYNVIKNTSHLKALVDFDSLGDVAYPCTQQVHVPCSTDTPASTLQYYAIAGTLITLLGNYLWFYVRRAEPRLPEDPRSNSFYLFSM